MCVRFFVNMFVSSWLFRIYFFSHCEWPFKQTTSINWVAWMHFNLNKFICWYSTFVALTSTRHVIYFIFNGITIANATKGAKREKKQRFWGIVANWAENMSKLETIPTQILWKTAQLIWIFVGRCTWWQKKKSTRKSWYVYKKIWFRK